MIAVCAVASMAPGGCAGESPKDGTGGPPAAPKQAAAPKAGEPGKDDTVQRKIRYTAIVDVVVKDLDAGQLEVERIVAEAGGYVARSEITGSAGTRRTGTWTLKIPVDKYRAAVMALAALGNTLRNSSDSEDVTEEFVDLEARLRNLRAEEETLNKLMKDSAFKLDDVLKMREQIVKTRGDIERAEGRLKYLSSVTSYSTVNLTLQEIQDYKPPTAPTFGSEVSETFAASVASLQHFGRGVAIFLVALAPWLPVVVPALFLLRWASRRLAKSVPPPLPRARRVPEPEPPPPLSPPPESTETPAEGEAVQPPP
jgi:hypothetical protein